jgi:hypothetical protein
MSVTSSWQREPRGNPGPPRHTTVGRRWCALGPAAVGAGI